MRKDKGVHIVDAFVCGNKSEQKLLILTNINMKCIIVLVK